MHHRIVLASLAFVILALCGTAAHAELGPKPPPADRFWGVLLVQSSIASGADYEQQLRFFRPEYVKMDDAMPDEMKLEFRKANSFELVYTFNFIAQDRRTVWDEWPQEYGHRLNEDDSTVLKNLADGEYVVALVHDGARVSNVAAFSIDSSWDIEDEPTLAIEVLEPPPFRDLPFLGARLTGNSRLTAKINNSSLNYPGLKVDGETCHWFTQVGGGFSMEVRPGDHYMRILDIGGNLSPAVVRGVAHDISIKSKEYQSETIHATPETPLGDAWDAVVQREVE